MDTILTGVKSAGLLYQGCQQQVKKVTHACTLPIAILAIVSWTECTLELVLLYRAELIPDRSNCQDFLGHCRQLHSVLQAQEVHVTRHHPTLDNVHHLTVLPLHAPGQHVSWCAGVALYNQSQSSLNISKLVFHKPTVMN